MCYLLCISIEDCRDDFNEVFSDELEVNDVSNSSFGKVTAAKNNGQAVVVTLNGCSCDILQGGHRVEGRPELLLNALTGLLKKADHVTLLKHWFTRPVDEVEVTAKGDKNMSLAQLKKTYPELDEDVRYRVKG